MAVELSSQFKEPRFRLRRPRGWKPTPDWHIRFEDIDELLDQEDSGLCVGLREASRLYEEKGELAAQYHLTRVRQQYAELFPGVAGEELLWAILCHAEPPIWRFDASQPGFLPRRNIFERGTPDDPVPPRYRSRFKGAGRKNARAGRRSPQRSDRYPGPDFEELMDLIEGNFEKDIIPLPYTEIAKTRGTTTTALYKHLHYLRTKLRLTWIRHAKQQAEYAEIIGGIMRAELTREQRAALETPRSEPPV